MLGVWGRYLPSMHEAVVQLPVPSKPVLVAHTSNPGTWEGPGRQAMMVIQSSLTIVLQAILVRPCQKN